MARRPNVCGRRLDLQRERHREILHHGERVEQDGPPAHDAKAIDDGEPVGAVGNRGGRTAEQPHVAAIGQRRAGDQVDEDLGGDLIESENGDVFAGGDG